MQNNIRALHSQEKDYSVLTTSARARARTRESVEDLGDYAADALGWNRVPPVVLGDIGRFLDQGMDPFVIMTAIDEASIAPRPSWNYARAILRRCIAERCLTVEAYEIRQAEYQEKVLRQRVGDKPLPF